jgi:hypothetical protein
MNDRRINWGLFGVETSGRVKSEGESKVHGKYDLSTLHVCMKIE